MRASIEGIVLTRTCARLKRTFSALSAGKTVFLGLRFASPQALNNAQLRCANPVRGAGSFRGSVCRSRLQRLAVHDLCIRSSLRRYALRSAIRDLLRVEKLRFATEGNTSRRSCAAECPLDSCGLDSCFCAPAFGVNRKTMP